MVFNEGLKKIENHAFYSCKNLEHINLPSTLIKVDYYAFGHCSLRKLALNEGLQKIGTDSFSYCSALQSIRLSSTVTQIGYSAFCGCWSLGEVVLNEGLQTIGQMAFCHCSSLERITIPHTVTKISKDTFYNCQNLREVGLHEGIQTIGKDAFEKCLSLERFTFPKSSTRLSNITRASLTEVENKIDNIRGLVERRGSKLFISADTTSVHTNRKTIRVNWYIVKGILGRIDRLLTHYKLKEATTLLELAMWKSKIEQARVNPIKRDVYRIDIPGPVKNTILQYLDFRV